MKKKFALVGAAGFVAPRHMRAIKDNGHELVAAMDQHDCVGIIDSYFPNTSFFTEYERFDRHLEKRRLEKGEGIDFLSICSPNYLHDFHIRMALRIGANAICEKPVVLNPWNINALKEIEGDSNNRVYTILQLRLHPKIVELKHKIEAAPKDKIHDIDLTYITSRGLWYYTSWKGDPHQSGGIATNIGVHFFDMLIWIFGSVKKNTVHLNRHDRAAGYLELEKARVRWFLSINSEVLPDSAKKEGKPTFRSISVDGDEIEFSGGFTDLHTDSYRHILDGGGFGLEDTLPAIQVVHDIRHVETTAMTGDYHPMAKLPLADHPFKK